MPRRTGRLPASRTAAGRTSGAGMSPSRTPGRCPAARPPRARPGQVPSVRSTISLATKSGVFTSTNCLARGLGEASVEVSEEARVQLCVCEVEDEVPSSGRCDARRTPAGWPRHGRSGTGTSGRAAGRTSGELLGRCRASRAPRLSSPGPSAPGYAGSRPAWRSPASASRAPGPARNGASIRWLSSENLTSAVAISQEHAASSACSRDARSASCLSCGRRSATRARQLRAQVLREPSRHQPPSLLKCREGHVQLTVRSKSFMGT